MLLLVIFLGWYFLFCKNNPKKYKKVEGKLSKILTVLLALSFISAISSPILAISLLGLLLTLMPIFAVSTLIIRALRALGIFISRNENNSADSSNAGTGSDSSAKSKGVNDIFEKKFTRSVPKRKKILIKFNKKYDLNLSDEEIDRIVEASYVSVAWEREIRDMASEYEVPAQWCRGNTAWLRVYFRVCPVKTISSDFARQRQICVDTFVHMFNDVNPGEYGSIEACISDMNARYFTNLDEATFMIVFRFLESEGRRYNMPEVGIVSNKVELDRLKEKYDYNLDTLAEMYDSMKHADACAGHQTPSDDMGFNEAR